jgi:hypothetical protein
MILELLISNVSKLLEISIGVVIAILRGFFSVEKKEERNRKKLFFLQNK